jgi:hypothetical protein
MIPKSEIDTRPKNDHMFWLKLGRETCNLWEWSFYCFLIIQENYGKSDPCAQRLLALYKKFTSISGVLDDFLCCRWYREAGSKEEHELLAALREYVQPPYRNTRDYVNITDVFYNIDNIEKPILRRRVGSPHSRKYPKFLVTEEIEYIQEFCQRMHEYIQYLKFMKKNTKFFDYPARFEKRFDKAVKTIDRQNQSFVGSWINNIVNT